LRRLPVTLEADIRADRALELGARDPVLRECLDVAPSGLDLVALRLQELKTPASIALYSRWVSWMISRRSGRSTLG